ncbi:MAG: hypothetical protein IKG61_00495 [Selenomonadaceae bacterium]|nr:hypothetical protein [Selenomonadaceae bacterium]
MSITEKMEREMRLWAAELNKSNKFLATSRKEKIFDFLNNRENLCTPGFILRRQLQMKFPELIEAAAKKSGVESYADLTKVGNVAWPSKLVGSLAKILTTTKFAKFGEDFLDIEKKQWESYLLDKSHCQCKTAIKLIFALEMDDATAAKFLLSNDDDLLSLRNPFDYACKSCLNCGLTYDAAEELFKNFSAAFENLDDNHKIALTNDFTRLVKSETSAFREQDIISVEDTKKFLSEMMFKYKDDFSEAGYSQQNINRLKVFLKYLMLLYPTVDRFIGKDLLNSEEIEKNSDGIPKILSHLITAMIDAQEIDLPIYTELSSYGGLNLPQRGALKRFYDNIPFNKNVLIPLRSLSQTLRSIMRAVKCPENARAVNRDTVLLLTYFFITAWRTSTEETRENFQALLEKDMTEAIEDSAEESLLYALEDAAYAIDSIEDGKEEPLKNYIAALNRMLEPFEFNEFYAPFVLDRFILICLLSEEENIMSSIIYESYRLSKNLIEQREGG